LKLISKLTLRTLRRRMTGEDASKQSPRRDSGTFRVKEQQPLPSRTIAASTPIPPTNATANAIGTTAAAHAASSFAPAASVATAVEEPQVLVPPEPVEEIEELDASEELVNDEIAASVNIESGVDTRTI